MVRVGDGDKDGTWIEEKSENLTVLLISRSYQSGDILGRKRIIKRIYNTKTILEKQHVSYRIHGVYYFQKAFFDNQCN